MMPVLIVVKVTRGRQIIPVLIVVKLKGGRQDDACADSGKSDRRRVRRCLY